MKSGSPHYGYYKIYAVIYCNCYLPGNRVSFSLSFSLPLLPLLLLELCLRDGSLIFVDICATMSFAYISLQPQEAVFGSRSWIEPKEPSTGHNKTWMLVMPFGGFPFKCVQFQKKTYYSRTLFNIYKLSEWILKLYT